jgi:hypothetical protein
MWRAEIGYSLPTFEKTLSVKMETHLARFDSINDWLAAAKEKDIKGEGE